MGIWKKITGIEKIERAREAEEQRLEQARYEAYQLEQEEEAKRQQREDEERKRQQAEKAAKEAAEKEAEEKRKAEEFAALSPKDQATQKGEPWVDVIETHVNEDNIRNGFFELDWNNEFIVSLKQAGYGEEADPEEEVVDRWFRDIVSQMLSEEGVDPQSRAAGYINVESLGNSRSEVS